MEKQIEQMAKIMCGHDCEECAKETAEWRGVSFEEAKAEQCLIKKRAELLYNAGCRKVPEDSIVLSMDEVFEFRKDQAEVKFLKKQIIDSARKETAEKILDKVDYESNGQTKQITDLLRKQFGLEVEE